MKRFFVFIFFLSSFLPSFGETYPSFVLTKSLISNSSEFISHSNQNKIVLDTSLYKLEIYDPSYSKGYFGLGFPGAASRALFYDKKPISVNPTFNSFSSLFWRNNVETNFNTKRPVTNIEYVIFPSLKTEQYLDILHTRNINKNINIGVCFRKLKSDGYYIHQGSNVTNLLAFVKFQSKNERYHLASDFVYNSLISLENGGVKNDTISFNIRGLALRSLPVNLVDAKNRRTVYGGSISQFFDFGKTLVSTMDSTTTKKFIPTSQLLLLVNYTSNASTYIDGQSSFDGFYKNTFHDSISTNDKSIFNQFKSELRFSTLEKKANTQNRILIWSAGLANELDNLNRKDIYKSFTNTSAKATLETNPTLLSRFAVLGNFFLEGYNKNNYEGTALIGRKFLDSTKNTFAIDLIASIQNANPDFAFANYYSNHFVWKNNFQKITTTEYSLRFSSPHIFNLQLNYFSLAHFVYLDSAATPAQLSDKLNYFSGRFDKLLILKPLYIDVQLTYQKVVSGKDVLGLPNYFTSSSVFLKGFLFKKAMDAELGFNILYASKYYGLAYQPALGAFYYQNKRQVGNYPAIDFFVNFKIKQARLFFKVDHLNYRLTNGNYAHTPTYLMPGRTFRFGINWLFIN